MPRGRRGVAVDASLLEAALMGFEQMRRNVEEKMAEIRQRLGTGRQVGGLHHLYTRKAGQSNRPSQRSLGNADVAVCSFVVRSFSFPSTDVTPSRFEPRRDGVEHGLLRSWS